MSVCFSSINLTLSQRQKLITDTTITPNGTKYDLNPKPVHLLKFQDELDTKNKESNDNSDNILLIPFSYAFQNKLASNNNIDHPRTSFDFIGKLNKKQLEVRKAIFELLNRTQSAVLAFATGFGKTYYAIYIASKLKYKTVILIVNRKKLMEQWKFSIRKTCPDARVQIIETKTKIDKNADFYIVNVTTIPKRSISDFKNIGFVISDEAHLLCSPEYSKVLFYFKPKYMVALSATIEKSNGLDKIVQLYFGSEIIERKLWYPCNVYYVNTGFKPKMEKSDRGTLDWNAVIKSQAECEYRNNMITKIAMYFKSKTFIILCKRKSQCEYLYKKLLEEINTDDNLNTKEKKIKCKEVEIYTGTKMDYDDKCRILIASIAKAGVGFDHPRADSLINASDVESQVLQYYGRIFRRDDVLPAVFDLVDDNFVMKKHWETRKEIYTGAGAVLKNFDVCFPEFYIYWKEMQRRQKPKIVFKEK